MPNELNLTIKSIINALETQVDDYIYETKAINSHVMYLDGQIKAYKNVLNIIEKETVNA